VPKVSVIIPAYNAAKHVRRTLESVFNQTYRDFEVIVVDDGSTDGTVDILKSYGDRVRWTIQQHQGQAYAINCGVGMAHGEYIAYFDADDLMMPTKLQVQADYLDAHPDVDVVYTDLYETSQQGERKLSRYAPLDPFALLQTCCVCRITIMHRRDCVEKVGIFDGTLTGTDDWDMWVRMSERCTMVHIGQTLSEYLIHGENISRQRARALDHCRHARWRILCKAYQRRGRPLWLRLMVLSAWAHWKAGRIPFIGERFPRIWVAVGRAQGIAERALLRWMAAPPRSEEGQRALPNGTA
jgi:glycosyltransferase involved in cell wall biosynthesis